MARAEQPTTDDPPSSTRSPDPHGPGRDGLSPAEEDRYAALNQSLRPSLEAVARKTISRACQGRLDAEGLVSQALEEVYHAIVAQHRRLLADEKQFYWFCVTALQNEIKDARATEEAQCRDVRRDQAIEPGSKTLHPAAPSTHGPSRILARQEITRKAHQWVDGLDPVDRHIVLGRVDKKSYADIGREISMTADAVRKRFVRILDKVSSRVRAWLGLSSPP